MEPKNNPNKLFAPVTHNNKDSSGSSDFVEVPKIDLVNINREKRRSATEPVTGPGKTSQYGNEEDPKDLTKPTTLTLDNDENMMFDDKGWTEKNNLLSLVWLNRCCKTWETRKSNAKKLIFLDRLLNISLFIFTGITMILGVSGGTNETFAKSTPSTGSTIILYLVGASAALTAIIQSIIKYLNLTKKIHAEKEAIKQLSNLMSQIEGVLHLEIEDRPPAKEFIKSILETFRKYQETGDILQEEVHNWKLRIKKAVDITNITMSMQQNRKNSSSGSDQCSWSTFRIVDDEKDLASIPRSLPLSSSNNNGIVEIGLKSRSASTKNIQPTTSKEPISKNV